VEIMFALYDISYHKTYNIAYVRGIYGINIL